MVFITPTSDNIVASPVPETSITVVVHPNDGSPLVDVTLQMAYIPHTSVSQMLNTLAAAVASQLGTI